MSRNQLVATTAVLVVLIVSGMALVIRSQTSPTAIAPAPTATATSTDSAPTLTPTPTVPPSASTAGVLSGRLGYPANMIPPLTVYAINVADQRVFFSVDTPRYGGDPTSPPAATIVPGTRPSYTITGVAPGTYYVLAYRNDDVNVEAKNTPGVYSEYVLQCLQPNEAGSTPAPGCSSSDHSLVPVTIQAGETARRIDVTDWYHSVPPKPSYPPRPR
jgi:hypothetical protein